MYNEYFGFSESPFENNLDQRFFFLSADHKEVLAALLYFIKENKALAMLCGDVGAGKTMLLNNFLDRLPESHTPIIILNPSVEYREILMYVASSLGITDKGQKVLDLIDDVNNALVERKKGGKYFFLVIDEAHLLSDQSLDDIRLLSNIETQDRKLLPILLVGQYELSYKLQNAKMRQLRQRISVNRFLSSLDFNETSRYIDHRLKLVGSNFAWCFETNCLALIYRLSDGVPRQINQMCDTALLICKASGLKKVNKKIVKKTYAALRSDLLFTPGSFKKKIEKSFNPLEILKLIALGSLMVLLFIGWLHYADVIKPFLFPVSLQFSNIKTITLPAAQNQNVSEKKAQTPQPFSVPPNTSSPEAMSQSPEMSTASTQLDAPGAETWGKDSISFSNGVNSLSENLLNGSDSATTPDNPVETVPQISAKVNPTFPSIPEGETGSSEGLLPFSPLTAAPPQEFNDATFASEKQLAKKEVESSMPSPQAEKKDFKEKEDSTTDKEERISDGSEKNQQPLSDSAPTPVSTTSKKTETEKQKTQQDHSAPALSKQQAAVSSKVTVKNGDNLTEIALQHYPKKERSGIGTVLKSNPKIENRDLIYPGQVLVLPEIEAKTDARQESGKKTENTFAVQICTLFNASSAFAEAYITELKQKGYPAYSAETKTKNDKIIYKIFIGNYSTKEEAETAALNFKKNEGKPDIIIKPEIAQSPESKKEVK